MGIIKYLKDKYREYKREKNRPHMTCSFNEGITQSDLLCFAEHAASEIHNKEISVSVDGPIIQGVVVSQSRLTKWLFVSDYNDYGHITGKYWLWSENEDSKIPGVVAESVKAQIVSALASVKQKAEDSGDE